MTITALTPKQQQVYGLLAEGLAVPEIAKRMKIGKPSIYQHMRKIRESGVTLPTEQLAPADPPASSNGASDNDDVTRVISERVNVAEGTIKAIDDELAALRRRLEELKAAREAAETQLHRHEQALAAYA